MEKVSYFSTFLDSFVKLAGGKALIQSQTLPPRGQRLSADQRWSWARKAWSVQTELEDLGPGKASMKGAQPLQAGQRCKNGNMRKQRSSYSTEDAHGHHMTRNPVHQFPCQTLFNAEVQDARLSDCGRRSPAICNSDSKLLIHERGQGCPPLHRHTQNMQNLECFFLNQERWRRRPVTA